MASDIIRAAIMEVYCFVVEARAAARSGKKSGAVG